MNAPTVPITLSLLIAGCLAYSAWNDSPERRAARLERRVDAVEARQRATDESFAADVAKCQIAEPGHWCSEFLVQQKELNDMGAELDAAYLARLRRALADLR
jgi:hypothetical protein